MINGTKHVIVPRWHFWFYSLTGVLPRRTDTIEAAWNRLSTRKLYGALCFLSEWSSRRALDFTKPDPDQIRARLPVPDAEDLKQAAEGIFNERIPPPWQATAAAKKSYKSRRLSRQKSKARARAVRRIRARIARSRL